MQVMGEVGRARAAERVSSTAKELGEKTAAGLTRTATAVSHQVRRAQGVRGPGRAREQHGRMLLNAATLHCTPTLACCCSSGPPTF